MVKIWNVIMSLGVICDCQSENVKWITDCTNKFIDHECKQMRSRGAQVNGRCIMCDGESIWLTSFQCVLLL